MLLQLQLINVQKVKFNTTKESCRHALLLTTSNLVNLPAHPHEIQMHNSTVKNFETSLWMQRILVVDSNITSFASKFENGHILNSKIKLLKRLVVQHSLLLEDVTIDEIDSYGITVKSGATLSMKNCSIVTMKKFSIVNNGKLQLDKVMINSSTTGGFKVSGDLSNIKLQDVVIEKGAQLFSLSKSYMRMSNFTMANENVDIISVLATVENKLQPQHEFQKDDLSLDAFCSIVAAGLVDEDLQEDEDEENFGLYVLGVLATNVIIIITTM